MKENKEIQEYIGTLTKEETLFCLDSDLIVRDSCVLESKNPFFGYYKDATPQVEKPRYLYLMLENPLNLIEAQRLNVKVNKALNMKVDTVLAEISIPGYPKMQALRLRDLPQYNQLSIVQQQFRDEGLIFKKHNKSFASEKALITIVKIFYFKMLEAGLYIDARQAHHGYFTIPKEIEWKAFQELTKEAKYDTHISSFDAAYARLYFDSQLNELVRIYRYNIDIEFLKRARDRYYHLLKV